MNKTIFFLLLSFFALSSPLLSEIRAAQTFTLHTQPNQTVGSLFATAIGEGKHLLIPDIPEFCFRSDHKQFTESPFYTTTAGKIPMQSFVNFIERSRFLFDDYDKQTAYQNALNRAIQEHKNFCTNKKRSEKSATIARQNLIEAEMQVFKLLDTIKISPEIIKRLENILAIPKKAGFFEMLKTLISRTIEKIVWVVTAAWRNFWDWGLAYFICSALFLFIPSLMYATDSPRATFVNWIPFHLIFTIPWFIGGILYGGVLALFYARRQRGYHEADINDAEIAVTIIPPQEKPQQL